MTFSISTKIQDGNQNLVPKINMCLHFMQKFKMAAKSGGKAIFCEKPPVDPADILQVKILLKSLYLTPLLRKVFLRFTQKFKMATKIGEKVIFVKIPQYTLDTIFKKNA